MKNFLMYPPRSKLLIFEGGGAKFAASDQMAGGKFSMAGGGDQKFAPSGQMAGGEFSVAGGSEA